jgi:geranylgeranyl diphosphate synthase type II
MDLNAYLSQRQKQVEAALEASLPPAKTKPARLHEAMRYSIFAGGKRLRPILLLAAAEACGGDSREALPAACAVEVLHTYSLIHDDLPCMDDDDLRRGKPTNHVVYGEGLAVLAGDALLTLAFELLAQARGWERYNHATLIMELARAAGSKHLIGGQAADLAAEGKDLDADELLFIHRNKTGALLTTCLRLGGMCANAAPNKLESLTKFGNDLGLAFQIIDDILDVTQSSEVLGKSAGKDAAAQKQTYPAVFGLEESRAKASQLTDSALAALNLFGEDGTALRLIAEYLLKREF